ncbi:hypothetical protein, partial [Thiolapillus sp.]
MTRTAGAPIGCQRPSRFWGLGCPKIYHEAEDTLVYYQAPIPTSRFIPTGVGNTCAAAAAFALLAVHPHGCGEH